MVCPVLRDAFSIFISPLEPRLCVYVFVNLYILVGRGNTICGANMIITDILEVIALKTDLIADTMSWHGYTHTVWLLLQLPVRFTGELLAAMSPIMQTSS